MRVGIYLVPLLDHVTGRERVVQGLLDALAPHDIVFCSVSRYGR
jgi:hypothetical protein